MAGFHQIIGPRKTAIRLALWACIAVIALLSLAPADMIARPEQGGYTELGGPADHMMGYAAAAFLAAITCNERGMALIALAFLAGAGALEWLQQLSPGRTSSLEDFIFSAAGVLVGVAASLVLKKLLATKPSKPT
jgi:VanZ family protein